ncbi:ketopantoate reductase PanE/ApbA C terminal-domain-containing protein [Microdochium bolleyi]|uniref:Ketopantoate reductase PanE/ApbA C terminal-domain-containing protein n=1 Tax=Microdochium bolleyi TaxID=196109 RepID=A0A136JBV5_9PEZI|nr:ketopantoate reductase PanE/ApbA C terminal-domain-containing protein [Microdochium bolleyi]
MALQDFSSQTTESRLYAWSLANIGDDKRDGARSASDPETIESHDRQDLRIHVLGVGNIGRLYALCLARSAARVPITLVVHRRELLQHWASRPGIEIVRDGVHERITDFDIEWWTDHKPERGPVREPVSGGCIGNLIIATKASEALPQVARLLPYLDQSSTVAFAQNGMCKLWPPLGDAFVKDCFPLGSSPSWLACVTTHGVTSLGPFTSLHASPAGVMVGTVASSRIRTSSSKFLSDQLCAAPGLEAVHLSERDLWIAQLEKLAVNVIINPLTALLRCKNGEIFVNRGDNLPQLVELLLVEAVQVFQALINDSSSESTIGTSQLGAGSGMHSRTALLDRFSLTTLSAMVYRVGEKVAENTSSMLQDVQANKSTEIHDLNGWLIDTAKALPCSKLALPMHEEVIRLVVKGKQMSRAELCDHLVPLRPS